MACPDPQEPGTPEASLPWPHSRPHELAHKAPQELFRASECLGNQGGHKRRAIGFDYLALLNRAIYMLKTFFFYCYYSVYYISNKNPKPGSSVFSTKQAVVRCPRPQVQGCGHTGVGTVSTDRAEGLAIRTPSLALHLVHVCSMTSLRATCSGPVLGLLEIIRHTPEMPTKARTGGRFALASQESVRDNAVFPLPDAQGVPRDLIEGHLSIRYVHKPFEAQVHQCNALLRVPSL